MKLTITSSRGEVRVDWANYALLRDNIQHYIEAGQPSDRFPAFHGLERAVDDGLARVDAARLRGELLGACYALRRVHLEDGAVSLRTRALLMQNASLPSVRGTTRARAAGWSLPADQQTGSLIRHLQPFISCLLAVTATAVDGDELMVRSESVRSPSSSSERLARSRSTVAVRGWRAKLRSSLEASGNREAASTAASAAPRQ